MVEMLKSLTLGQIVQWAVLAMAALSTVLEFSKIKVNPWSAMGRFVGRAINKELSAEIAGLKKDISKLKSDMEESKKDAQEERAVNCRERILRFGDETIHGTRHTKEHFDQILDDITAYERYCDEHKDFPNEKTVITSRRIKEIYEKCLQDNDFL